MSDTFPHLQLRQLRQLIAVAQAGSIRRAAESLAIAQPALSRSIRSLEEQLQVKLMTRGPRGIELTDYGSKLVDYAKIVETHLHFAHEEIEDMRGGKEGRVRLGIGPFEGAMIVSEAVDRFLENRPGAEVAIIEGNFDNLMPLLQSGDIDLMLGPTSPRNVTPGLKSEILMELEPVPVVRAEHPLAKSNQVMFEQLADQQWILPFRGTTARDERDNLFRRHGLSPPKSPIEAAPSLTSKALVLRRDVIAILPRQLLEPELDTGKLIILPVDGGEFTVRVQLTTREFGKLPPACRDMIAYIRAVCAETPPLSAS